MTIKGGYNMKLLCWNGVYGCTAFEIYGWDTLFKDIYEAGKYYKEIWGHCWVEDNSKVIYKF